MARFQKILDIWKLDEEQRKALQPGQWVYAGNDTPLSRGRFLGVKPSGSVVVAWQGNAKHHPLKPLGYTRALRKFAKGGK